MVDSDLVTFSLYLALLNLSELDEEAATDTGYDQPYHSPLLSTGSLA